MRIRPGTNGRVESCILAIWLVVVGATIGSVTEGSASMIAIGAIVVAALAGLVRHDWRETLAVGLVGATITAWAVSETTSDVATVLIALAVILTGLIAGCARPRTADVIVTPTEGDRVATPAPAGARLPPGVADEALLDRLAIHEMTRARRYERPLTLLLIGVDGWSTLVAERGRRAAFEALSTLAVRVRRLLRDVDAIGLHGDGRLAVLLPETPLDGALVVAYRMQQAALEDVGLRTRIGAAVFPDDAVTVEALVLEAEAGLDVARLENVGVVQRVQIG